VAKTQELKSKDGGIDTLENVAGEMSQNIAALQSEIASLQVICYQRHTTFYLFFRNLLRKQCSSTTAYTVKGINSCRGAGRKGQGPGD
jgi:hypothetical protein